MFLLYIILRSIIIPTIHLKDDKLHMKPYHIIIPSFLFLLIIYETPKCKLGLFMEQFITAFQSRELTSGAIHLYVPVSAVITPDWAFTLATPKSATLTTCMKACNIILSRTESGKCDFDYRIIMLLGKKINFFGQFKDLSKGVFYFST